MRSPDEFDPSADPSMIGIWRLLTPEAQTAYVVCLASFASAVEILHAAEAPRRENGPSPHLASIAFTYEIGRAFLELSLRGQATAAQGLSRMLRDAVDIMVGVSFHEEFAASWGAGRKSASASMARKLALADKPGLNEITKELAKAFHPYAHGQYSIARRAVERRTQHTEERAILAQADLYVGIGMMVMGLRAVRAALPELKESVELRELCRNAHTALLAFGAWLFSG